MQHAQAHQTSAAPGTEVPSLAGTPLATGSGQHLPQAAKQLYTHFANGDSCPDLQHAVFGSQPGHNPEPPSLATAGPEPPSAVPQPRSAADIDSSRDAGTSCQSDSSLLQQQNVAPVLSSLAQPVASQQQPSMKSSELRPVYLAKGDVPGGHNRKSACKLTSSDTRPEQAGADVAQSRKRTSRQAASAAQVLGSAGAPGMTKPRPGLRSQADTTASNDKARMAALCRPEFAHRKQAGAERGRSGHDMVLSSNSRGMGRGRAFGRGGRRGRARSALFRTSHSETQPAGTPLLTFKPQLCINLYQVMLAVALQGLHTSHVTLCKASLSCNLHSGCAVGDLDEAVQALKATAEGMMPAVCTTGGPSVLEDDELKPSFMRRVSSDRSPPAKEPAAHDPNPRPVTRRRTEATRNTQPAKAKAAMQV